MLNNIHSIFNSITPENIKDIPVFRDAMNIFIETLEELSKESINLKHVFENKEIKEELLKVYLNDLYMVFESIQRNQKVLDAIDKINIAYNPPGVLPGDPGFVSFINKDIIPNVVDKINEEHFLTFKAFKERKGTVASIKYIHDLVNSIFENRISDTGFSIQEIDVFNMKIAGSMPKEFYDYIVHPLAHPIGFLYEYDRIVSFFLEDFYAFDGITYNVSLARVACLDENGVVNYDVYIDSENTSLSVISIEETTTVEGRVKIVKFNDFSYLKQTTLRNGQITVAYYDSNNIVIQQYNGQCAIQIEYDIAMSGDALTDNIEFNVDLHRYDRFARRDPLNDIVSTNQQNGIGRYDVGFNNVIDNNGEHSIYGDGVHIIVGAPNENTETGKAYVYDISDGGYRYLNSISAQIPAQNSEFGSSVAVSGSRVVIGSPADDTLFSNSGCVYVYDWDGFNYRQIAKLTAIDAAQSDYFGSSVAIDGDIIVVGAFNKNTTVASGGKVYIYKWNGINYSLLTALIAPSPSQNDYFGRYIAVSGSRIAICSPGAITNGNIYIYDIINNSLSFVDQIVVTSGIDPAGFNMSLDMDGARIAVGILNNNLGKAFVYDQVGTSYQQIAELIASDYSSDDSFGSSISIHGKNVAVGAETKNVNGNTGSGKVYVFGEVNGLYQELLSIIPSDYSSQAYFGYSVSILGNKIAVGANLKNKVYMYNWDSNSYAELGNFSTPGVSGQFGRSIAIGGGRKENFYSPDAEADLKILEGKFVKHYDVIHDGQTVYTQRIKYTNTVDPLLKVVDWVPSAYTYNRQNRFNTDFVAKDIIFDTQSFQAFNSEILKEGITGPSDPFIDYNGNTRGSYTQYLAYVNSHDVSEDYMVGGYFQEYDLSTDPLELSNQILWLDTPVDADPVNLQYNTLEVTSTIYSPTITDNVNIDEAFLFQSEVNTNLVEFVTFSDSSIHTTETSINNNESHVELDDSEIWFDQIGVESAGFEIGTGWITYKTTTVQTDTFESYADFGIFDKKADDDFSFGVYRGNDLLEDNNVSAL